MSVPNRAGDPRRQANWKSAWPVGHANYHEEVTPEQQSRNLRSANPSKFDELTRNNGVPDRKDEQPVNWKSAWPKGHPNYHEEVK